MRRKLFFTAFSLLVAFFILGITADNIFADGTETLGVPTIEIAPGSGFVTAGTGLFVQPSDIYINVPGTVEQALLYWQCEPGEADGGDDTITVNGFDVTGLTIGGPTFLNPDGLYTITYRVDITGMVSTGENTLTINDLDCTPNGVIPAILNNGAGALVIYDDGSPSDIFLRDGSDYAYCPFQDPLDTTDPQTFSFASSTFERTANLSLSVGSVEEENDFRPNRIKVNVGADEILFENMLNSGDGEQWDTFTREVAIPAGATELTVEAISPPEFMGDPLCASLAWNTAALSIPQPYCGDGNIDENETCDPPGEPQGMPNECRDDCTFCGDGIVDPGEECDDGNNDDGDDCSATCTVEQGGEGCTPGYWKQCQHFGSWTAPLTPDTEFSAMFGSNVFGDMTLLEVLSQGGGGIIALGRHAVAALLNAASQDVSYDRSTMQVKMMFNNALVNGNIEEVKNMLEGFNEQGCPVGLNPGADCGEKEKKDK